MQAVASQIGLKYQIVIPQPVREALGVRPHDSLLFVMEGDTIIVRSRPASLTAALRGLHAGLWSDPEAWLAGERASWE